MPSGFRGASGARMRRRKPRGISLNHEEDHSTVNVFSAVRKAHRRSDQEKSAEDKAAAETTRRYERALQPMTEALKLDDWDIPYFLFHHKASGLLAYLGHIMLLLLAREFSEIRIMDRANLVDLGDLVPARIRKTAAEIEAKLTSYQGVPLRLEEEWDPVKDGLACSKACKALAQLYEVTAFEVVHLIWGGTAVSAEPFIDVPGLGRLQRVEDEDDPRIGLFYAIFLLYSERMTPGFDEGDDKVQEKRKTTIAAMVHKHIYKVFGDLGGRRTGEDDYDWETASDSGSGGAAGSHTDGE